MGVLFEFVGLSALVIALAYAALRFLGRRVGPGRRNLCVREALSLGPNRLLALVQVAGKVYLVGVSPNRIDLLDEVDPAELEPEPHPAPAQAPRVLTLAMWHGLARTLAGSSRQAARLQELEERLRRLVER
jgi:flagellar biogenesis protein FliO